ncbi:MAG: PH domain-containing protein [Gammaproteobacteria bacterium]|nr:PH domain-containing protein [Gammaproteobacteria bacterium]
MTHLPLPKIYAAPETPFPDFQSASFMRDQLNRAAPEYLFVIQELPMGGFVIQPSKTSKQPIGSQTGGENKPNETNSPLKKVSEETRNFFERVPIVLRPAKRMYFFRWMAVFLFAFFSVFSEFILKATLPTSVIIAWYQKFPILPALLFWGFIAIALYHFLTILKVLYSNAYIITLDAIISRKGLIARDTHTVKFEHIRTVVLKQSVLGRLFNVGTLEFDTVAGPEGPDVIFTHIAKPAQIRRCLLEYLSACQ